MRGISPSRSSLSAARAFLAGAALLATATASFGSAAQARQTYKDRPPETAEDTAMAVPRLPSFGGGGVSLPRPLPAAEARLLTQAFQDPAAPLDALQDSTLLGHVLASRYLAAPARIGLDDLRTWLSRYPDLPDAPAIHALLISRLPRGAPPIAPPALAAFAAAPAGDAIEAAGHFFPRNPLLDRSIHEAARAGQFDRAQHLVAITRGLPRDYASLLRAEIAHAMFGQGRDRDALDLAQAAARAQPGIGLAAWVSGLAAWRLGRPNLARSWFEAAYRAPLIAPGQRAAAAFWAARTSLLIDGEHGPWMQRAAADPRTFYGLLARRVLGQRIPAADAPKDTLGEADVDAVASTARGRRAMGLLQVGQPARAEAELRLLSTEMRDEPGFTRSITVVARAAGLTELTLQLDAIIQPATVRLPTSRLRPAGGFRLDPALVYALTRLESNFDATAVSPAGARGLMQLMPVTARTVQTGHDAASLHDPATNLDLGQRYLMVLANLDSVGSDLIRLLATYNAGIGNMARWQDSMRHEDDPLLFLESLPGDETRAYVPRALAYTWLYAAQLGLPSPSLDDLAAGLWPRLQIRPTTRQPAIRLH